MAAQIESRQWEVEPGIEFKLILSCRANSRPAWLPEALSPDNTKRSPSLKPGFHPQDPHRGRRDYPWTYTQVLWRAQAHTQSKQMQFTKGLSWHRSLFSVRDKGVGSQSLNYAHSWEAKTPRQSNDGPRAVPGKAKNSTTEPKDKGKASQTHKKGGCGGSHLVLARGRPQTRG